MKATPCSLLGVALAVAAVFLLAPVLVAQPHDAPWSIIAGGAGAPTIGQIDKTGAITTVLTTASVPANTFGQDGTFDIDDQTYVLALLSKAVRGTLLRVDRLGNVVATIAVSPTSPQNGGGYLLDVGLDQDGNYLVVEGNGGGNHANLLRVTSSGNVTTIFQGTPLTNPVAVAVDIDSGNYRVLDRNRGVYGISRDGSTVTTIGMFASTSYNELAQQISTGDLFATSASNTGPIFRMTASGGVSTLRPTGLSRAYGIHFDRASAAAERFAVGSSSTTSGVYFVDPATQAITTLANTTNWVYYDVFPHREVTTIKRAAGRWEISLYLQNDAGANYAVGLSLSGVRPATRLPDGRKIHLVLDDLTRLSLSGQLAPLFTGHTGTLNATGRGVAILDVSALPALSGFDVYIGVVTLNQSAPSGVQTIADPVRLRL